MINEVDGLTIKPFSARLFFLIKSKPDVVSVGHFIFQCEEIRIEKYMRSSE